MPLVAHVAIGDFDVNNNFFDVQVHLPVEFAYSGIQPVTSVTSHYLELILQVSHGGGNW